LWPNNPEPYAELPSFSFLITTWNSKVVLIPCLESLLRSKITHSFEVIISDADSSDGTLEYVSTLPEQYKRRLNLVFKTERDGGWPHAINVGASVAKGKWLLISNPDLIFNDTIDSLMSYAIAHQEQRVIGVNVMFPNGALTPHSSIPSFSHVFFCFTDLGKTLDAMFGRGSISRNFWQNPRSTTLPYYCDHPTSVFLCVRSDLFSRMGGFDESFWLYFADSEFMLRVKSLGIHPVVYSPTLIGHVPSHSVKLRSPKALAAIWRSSRKSYARRVRGGQFILVLILSDEIFRRFRSILRRIRRIFLVGM